MAVNENAGFWNAPVRLILCHAQLSILLSGKWDILSDKALGDFFRLFGGKLISNRIQYFAIISLPHLLFPLAVNGNRGPSVSYLVPLLTLNALASQDFSESSESTTNTDTLSCFCMCRAYGLKLVCLWMCVCVYVCMYIHLCMHFCCVSWIMWVHMCVCVSVCACIYPPRSCLNVSSSMEFSHLLQESPHCWDYLSWCFFT